MATTASAESHPLASNTHFWLRVLPVDEKQVDGDHLAPQALNGLVSAMAYWHLALTNV